MATSATPVKLTQAQAQKIATAVLGEQSPTLGNFPWPRLEAALGVSNADQARALAAQALLQTGHSDAQIKSILTLPHGASVAQLIQQDLEGALIAFGAAGVGAGAGAAAADAAAGGADAAGAGAAGAATTASSASGIAGYASKGLGDLASLAKAGGIAALLVDPHFLWRAVQIVGGAILILMGLRWLANSAGANIGNPISTGAKVAAVAA